jgi:hypothetical protein
VIAAAERLGPGAIQDEVDVGSFGVDIERGDEVVEDAWLLLMLLGALVDVTSWLQ